MVKPRENRVPMMLSDAELEAIDTWRFENRVATRSEAIRRLCQLGLILHNRVNLSSKLRHDTSSGILDMAEALGVIDADGKMIAGFPRNELEAGFEKLTSKAFDINTIFRELADQTYAVTAGKNMEAVLQEMEVTTEIYNRMLGRPSKKEHWTIDQIVGKENPPSSEDDVKGS